MGCASGRPPVVPYLDHQRVLIAPINANTRVPDEILAGVESTAATLERVLQAQGISTDVLDLLTYRRELSEIASERGTWEEVLAGQELPERAQEDPDPATPRVQERESEGQVGGPKAEGKKPAAKKPPGPMLSSEASALIAARDVAYDLLVVPNVVLRVRASRGGDWTAAFDGVKRRLYGEPTFLLTSASLALTVYSRGGEVLYQGVGGLDVLGKPALVEDPFGDPRNIREGVCIAVGPFFGDQGC